MILIAKHAIHSSPSPIRCIDKTFPNTGGTQLRYRFWSTTSLHSESRSRVPRADSEARRLPKPPLQCAPFHKAAIPRVAASPLLPFASQQTPPCSFGALIHQKEGGHFQAAFLQKPEWRSVPANKPNRHPHERMAGFGFALDVWMWTHA